MCAWKGANASPLSRSPVLPSATTFSPSNWIGRATLRPTSCAWWRRRRRPHRRPATMRCSRWSSSRSRSTVRPTTTVPRSAPVRPKCARSPTSTTWRVTSTASAGSCSIILLRSSRRGRKRAWRICSRRSSISRPMSPTTRAISRMRWRPRPISTLPAAVFRCAATPAWWTMPCMTAATRVRGSTCAWLMNWILSSPCRSTPARR